MPCKFYPAGLCKYGEACKFKHTNTEEELPIPELNILGLPKRLGKMNCDFYIRTGLCSFGVSCRYNHPDPVMILYPESVNKRKQVFQSSKSRCSRISVPVMRSNSPIVHQNYAVTESQVCLSRTNRFSNVLISVDGIANSSYVGNSLQSVSCYVFSFLMLEMLYDINRNQAVSRGLKLLSMLLQSENHVF
ncbi:uncharacterized protein LOC143622271 [Bidens hawaiensis]|uniref:uncharacterized protein LOC143622271 n=1 Tax=Bidens hawaiensis TaxID=980011 RepID=UPI00404AB05B